MPNPQSSDMRHAHMVNDVSSSSGISFPQEAVNFIPKPSLDGDL